MVCILVSLSALRNLSVYSATPALLLRVFLPAEQRKLFFPCWVIVLSIVYIGKTHSAQQALNT